MAEKKHAYCIIAHNDPKCLQTLVSLIDDERNDIILLIDKKVDASIFSGIHASKSRIIKPATSQMIDIQWGGASQLKAELLVFATALSEGDYSYLHLLSGVDLPLKSQDYIHRYFENLPNGANLIGFAQGSFNKRDLWEKTNYFHAFTGTYKHPNKLIRYATAFFRLTFLKMQKVCGYKRYWGDLLPYKGANWVSITSDFAQYLVERKDFILKRFRGVPCADEIYKQTMLMASPFKSTVFDVFKDFAALTRKIDWTRGNPYVWRECDFNELVSSKALFARKFSSAIDSAIIKKISNHITDEL